MHPVAGSLNSCFNRLDFLSDFCDFGSSESERSLTLNAGQCSAVLEGHGDAVTCLTLAGEQGGDMRIVSGSLDRTIKVWCVREPACLQTMDWMTGEGHTGVVRCLQVVGSRILSAADDKTIKVWDLPTGRRLVTLRCRGEQ